MSKYFKLGILLLLMNIHPPDDLQHTQFSTAIVTSDLFGTTGSESLPDVAPAHRSTILSLHTWSNHEVK